MSRTTDHAGRPIVAITGAGVVSSLGNGKQENWAKLTGGKSGIHRIKRFPTEHLRTTIAGTVDFMTPVEAGSTALTYALAETAALEAITESGLSTSEFGGPLFLAAPPVELEWWQRFKLDEDGKANGGSETGYERLLLAARSAAHEEFFQSSQFGSTAEKLQQRIGTRGLPITLSTACASGATAIQLGAEAIRRGEADRVISVATDGSVTAEALIRFSLLSALSTQNDVTRKGVQALLQGPRRLRHGRRRRRFCHGIAGKRQSARRDHPRHPGRLRRMRRRFSPNPLQTGRFARRLPRFARVLDDAGVSTGDIDYINAHGTSTPENDKMEYLSLSTVFGDAMKPRSRSPPTSR
jgi:3-oxoacyl-[acyl-carrier-protein] synthase II